MAMEKASESPSEAGAGMGMGVGLMMPAMFAEAWKQSAADASVACPDCRQSIPADSKFCPRCGHQLLIFSQCGQCGKNLTPHARFCSRCGHPVAEKAAPRKCPHCGTENLPDSVYCNQCGEKL